MINIRYALTGALLLMGSATLASAQQSTQPQGAHGKHARAHGMMGMMGGPGARGLLKGITLSDAEKANLKVVREKYAAQQKALREQFKPQMQAAREARQRGDTVALKELWQKSAGQREQTKQLMLAERNDLRAALTPANQTKFDANVAELQKRIAAREQNGAKRGRLRPPGRALR
jgi:Spy/CpxP family protein refolding chaperone